MEIDFKNSKIIVEEVLKSSDYEQTNKIFLSMPDCSRKGPFIQKIITSKDNLGIAYEQIYKAQLAGTKLLNIPKIFHCEKKGDKLHVILQFIEGISLQDYIETNTINSEQLKDIFMDICKAVDSLHTKITPAIIHRDIKPSNIIVQPENAFLTDFGIARRFNELGTTDTQHFGTVGYASPEQYGFAQTDERSDIYSLGKLLEFLKEHSLLSQNQLSVLNYVIKKATALDPAARFASVRDLFNDFNSQWEPINKKQLQNPTTEPVKDSAVISKLVSMPSHFMDRLCEENSLVLALAIIWDIFIVSFFVLFIFSSFNYVFFDTNALYKTSNLQGICAIISLVGFICLPGIFVFTIKAPIRKIFKAFPYFKIRVYLLTVTLCFVMCIVFAFIAYPPF